MAVPHPSATELARPPAAAESPVRGLSSSEAAARLAVDGPNELAPPPRFAAMRELLHHLANPLVLILIVVSASFLGDGLRDALDPRQK